LEAGLAKLDLVTREEFDIQTAVLTRTREKLTRLEAEVAKLESQRHVGVTAKKKTAARKTTNKPT